MRSRPICHKIVIKMTGDCHLAETILRRGNRSVTRVSSGVMRAMGFNEEWTMKRTMIMASLAGLVAATSMSAAVAQPEPRGRLHFDWAFHDSDQTELANGHRMRRARIGVDGSIDDDWSYKSEVDFSENGVSFQDAYIAYDGFGAGSLRIGHIKAPYGMDNLTSSNHTQFMERSLPTAFVPGRLMGVSLDRHEDSYGFSTMLMGQPLETNDTRVATDSDESFGLAGRFYLTPMRGEESALHLGVAATVEDAPETTNETYRFRARPESRVTGDRFVDTGDIGNRSGLQRLALEAAWQAGPVVLQSEYMTVSATGDDGAPDYDFDGFYAQGSYTFGGRKSYRGGAFRNAGVGAWELSLRYSNINLNDGAILGGEEDNITLGLNYYPAENVRLMANYVSVDSEVAGGSDDPGLFLIRTQISF